jgi:hypothetical protein
MDTHKTKVNWSVMLKSVSVCECLWVFVVMTEPKYCKLLGVRLQRQFPTHSHPPHGAIAHWAKAFSLSRNEDHTQTHHTLGRTTVGEWSARRRDLYLPTLNKHYRYPCPPMQFEPAIPASERPQTYVLRRRGHCDRLKTASVIPLVQTIFCGNANV